MQEENECSDFNIKAAGILHSEKHNVDYIVRNGTYCDDGHPPFVYWLNWTEIGVPKMHFPFH